MSDNIDLQIELQNKEALSSLEKFEKEATASVGATEKSFGTLKKVAAAAVAFLAAREVVQFFGEGIDAAIAQENAMRALETQLEQTGEMSQKAMNDFAAFANTMEATTKFGDDLVLSQVAIAKSFGISNAEAEQLVKTAADLAAATGQSLDSAVQQLGKTLGGTTGRLDEMVPALRGLTKEQLANGEAIKVIAERYGGAAENEIQTFSGALLQTGNAFGNLQEAFGNILVQNEAVIAAISGVREIFAFLEQKVIENEASLKSFVHNGLKIAAATATGMAGAMAHLAEIFAATTGAILGGIADFAKGAAGLLSFVPGAEEAALAMSNFGDETEERANSVTESLGNIAVGFSEFEGVVSQASEKIFKADTKVEKSAKQATQARRTMVDRGVKDVKDLTKAIEEAAKFEAKLRQDSASEIEKALEVRKEQLREIERFEKEGALSKQKADELRVVSEQNLIGKLEKLREEADKKALEDAKKAAEEQRAAVEEIASSPITYAVKNLEITPAASADFQKGLAGGAGLLNSILGGRQGAEALFASGGAALADAFAPGAGAAVGPLITQLMKGPEETKRFIREFVEAVPDIVEAIAESAPVVVEALVDSLINEGGAVRIAVAIARAMSGEATLRALGRQLGVEFKNAFNAPNVGKVLGSGLQQGAAAGATAFTQSIGKWWTEVVPGMVDAAFGAVTTFFDNLSIAVPTPDWLTTFDDIAFNFSKVTPGWFEEFQEIVDQLTGWVPKRLGGGGGGGGYDVPIAPGVNVNTSDGNVSFGVPGRSLSRSSGSKGGSRSASTPIVVKVDSREIGRVNLDLSRRNVRMR